ncbi:F-type ATPase subunit b [uncultured Clostridium sp.]|uniref:F0F1 ATP synthase subunit B n=1 Tax=uncultured Clostridium sp. TaxID=59620 RepID=UPI000823333E|nr:F0F1 ATP synthase subunit B [uncultured Clostridium sp.]SCK01557.1 F-type ATPase subunit b [uncultured Clostridium sp.]
MEINIGVILASIVNTAILYIILKHFFFDKVKAVINQREEYINKTFLEAEEATEKAETIRIESEKRIEELKRQSRKITEDEKRKAEDIYRDIVDEAKRDAEVIKEKARAEIEREKKRNEYVLKERYVSLAMELSEQLIEKNIDEGKNKDLIDEFIAKVGD